MKTSLLCFFILLSVSLAQAQSFQPFKKTKAAGLQNFRTGSKAITLDSVVSSQFKSYFYYNADGQTISEIEFETDPDTKKWVYRQKKESLKGPAGTEGYIIYSWNKDSGQWEGTHQSQNITDTAGTYFVNFIGSANGKWLPLYRYDYPKDTLKNYSIQYYYEGNYVDSVWIPRTKTESIMDTNQNVISQVIYNYTGTDWISGPKKEFTYDSAGNQLSITSFIFSADSIKYDPYYKQEFGYTSKGKLKTSSNAQYDKISGWITSDFTETTYNDTLPVTSVRKIAGSNGSLENNYKLDYLFDERGNNTAYVTSNWVNNNWQYESKQLHTYNSLNDILVYEYYFWNDTTKAWKGNYKDVYNLDTLIPSTDIVLPSAAILISDHKILSVDRYKWEKTGWTSDITMKYFYSVDIITAVDASGSDKTEVSAWPNPFTSAVHITGLPANSEISVLDHQGKPVLVTRADGKLHMDHLNNGMYYVVIKGSNIHKTVKMIKQN